MSTQNNDLATTLEIVDLIAKSGQILHCRLGSGRYKLLSTLLENEIMAQKQLQDELKIRSGSISEIIAKLETEGIVKKEKSSKDARKVMLRITSKGVAQTKKMQREFESRVENVLCGISEKDIETFKCIIEKILQNLNDGSVI